MYSWYRPQGASRPIFPNDSIPKESGQPIPLDQFDLLNQRESIVNFNEAIESDPIDFSISIVLIFMGKHNGSSVTQQPPISGFATGESEHSERSAYQYVYEE